MSTLTARHIIKRVRGIINRIPVDDGKTGIVDAEEPWTMLNTSWASSGTIADELLVGYVNQVQRYISTHSKVFHLSGLSQFADTSTGPTASDDQIKIRSVHGTIKRTNSSSSKVRARFRELSEHRDLENSGRNATEDYPAYTYLEHDITIYPTPTSGSEALYVLSPSQISIFNMKDESDTLDVDSRFEGAIVSYVAAKAFRQLEEATLHDAWMNLFYRKMEPFLIGTRIGDPRTHLVSGISYELDNELE